jgi:hypothetical protein
MIKQVESLGEMRFYACLYDLNMHKNAEVNIIYSLFTRSMPSYSGFLNE